MEVVKLATLYQRKNECCVFCSSLTTYAHTVLKQQFYWFHHLKTEDFRYFSRTIHEDVHQRFSSVYHEFIAFLESVNNKNYAVR